MKRFDPKTNELKNQPAVPQEGLRADFYTCCGVLSPTDRDSHASLIAASLVIVIYSFTHSLLSTFLLPLDRIYSK